MSDVRGSAYLK
ncbi:hypothetical protein F383_12434 [Gossypium arboreum]|uniref:Uncharacterized protein n=1 Tax=Gossypium arboreum TaxID=29729 RepID=A0A0B0PVD7_GOSAR|nr:hypothetical protein F383_12434 [Gossypium arboreum]